MIKLKHSHYIDGKFTINEGLFLTLEAAIFHAEEKALEGIVKIYNELEQIIYQIIPVECLTYA